MSQFSVFSWPFDLYMYDYQVACLQTWYGGSSEHGAAGTAAKTLDEAIISASVLAHCIFLTLAFQAVSQSVQYNLYLLHCLLEPC